MMLCVMMLPLVVVGCTSKQSVSQCVKPPAPGVDNAASSTGRHRWTGLFHPQRERLITMQKQLEGTQKYINEQDRAPISMGNSCNYWWVLQYQRFLCWVRATPKVIKPSNPFTNVCWVSVLTTFSAPPQILAASTASPNSRNEEMMGIFLGATAGVFVWTVNVCWAHSVIRSQRRKEWDVDGVIPDAF